MELLSPNPQASPQPPAQRRGKKPGKPLTPRELASRRANLVKARAAYRPTEKRLRASRANFEKAIAARRAPPGNASARLNALKHGLFAQQTLAESMDRLREDKEEFAQHLRFFERVFIPADDEEKPIVRGLAETVWRRLRFFHAQARWEKERMERLFANAPTPAQLSPENTAACADRLTLALMDFEAFYRELDKLESQVEFWLRKLIRKRSQGQLRWKGFSPRRDPVIAKLEKDEQLSRYLDYWDSLSPEEQAAMLAAARKEADAKMAVWEKEHGIKD